MIAMRFHSDLFQGIGDTSQFLGINYTPTAFACLALMLLVANLAKTK